MNAISIPQGKFFLSRTANIIPSTTTTTNNNNPQHDNSGGGSQGLSKGFLAGVEWLAHC